MGPALSLPARRRRTTSRPGRAAASRLAVLAALALACDRAPTGASAAKAATAEPPPATDRPAPATAPAPTIPPPAPPSPAVTPAVPPPSAGALIEDERNTIEVFRAASAAAVYVTQVAQVRRGLDMRPTEIPTGTGTGFIWDREGHVVTNFHVVASGRRGNKLLVRLESHDTYPARVVGVDPSKDIAVLRIDAPADKLTPVRPLPPTERVQVGQKTVAIGNPFGLDHTLTVGVVSALGREVKGIGGVTIRDMIQTDAAINPGNSGGPLLDSQARLIGMNTMIVSRSGASAGVGFAVPIQTLRRVVPQIIRDGRPTRVGMGVSVLDDSIARRLGIDGVIIHRVAPGSPAARAGLRGLTHSPTGPVVRDVIVQVAGDRVRTFDDLYTAFDAREAGDLTTVSILDAGTGAVRDVQVRLDVLD